MIRKRNLDSSLIQWIMTVTGLGPGIGEIEWVAKAASSTSRFSTHLADSLGIDNIHADVAAGYASVLADRNDVILVMPGAYDEDTSIDWAKDNTHLIGLGGPVTQADYSEKNVVTYTDTAAVDFTIDLTGDHCQFLNMGINNVGNSATNYAALRLNGYGNFFKNCTFIGVIGSSQLSAAACGSLYIHSNGHNSMFDNCVIGEDCWGARTGSRSGQIVFSGSQPNGGRMRDCYIRSQSSTTAVAMVRIVPIGVGRGWLFERCFFYNYGTSNLNQCFASSVNDTTHSWTDINLKDCYSKGIDRWTDHSVDYIYGGCFLSDDGGGQAIALDETAAGSA